MKNRCPSEQNSRTVRVSIGDYTLLSELSQRAGITMAEALDLALARTWSRPAATKATHRRIK